MEHTYEGRPRTDTLGLGGRSISSTRYCQIFLVSPAAFHPVGGRRGSCPQHVYDVGGRRGSCPQNVYDEPADVWPRVTRSILTNESEPSLSLLLCRWDRTMGTTVLAATAWQLTRVRRIAFTVYCAGTALQRLR